MIELTAAQILSVSGGYTVYMTEEWKQSDAQEHGIVGGGLGAVMGFLLALPALDPTPGAMTAVVGILGAAVGAVIGYYSGYGLAKFGNSYLENNTWYEMTYYVY